MADLNLIDLDSDGEVGINALARVAERERLLMEAETRNQQLAQQLAQARADLHRTAAATAPPPAAMPVDHGLASVLSLLTDVLRDQHDGLPKKEPDVFKGDIFLFPVWLNSYHVLVEKRCRSVCDKNYYLSKYTGGEARKCIEGMLALNTATAYERAIRTLKERYGDRLKLAKSFRDRLEHWPTVRYGDGKALRDLSDFLNQCDAAMSTLGNLSVLDDPCEQLKILEKLPKAIQGKWLVIVDKALYGDDDNEDYVNSGEYPSFSKLCKFLTKQARIACNALVDTGNQKQNAAANVPHVSKSGSSSSTWKAKASSNPSAATFSTSTSSASAGGNAAGNNSGQAAAPTPQNFGKCVLCSTGNHSLDFCSSFKGMTLSERNETIKKHGLCFGCFKWGHRARDCHHRRKCERCSGLHPTLLHDDDYKSKPKVNSRANYAGVTGSGGFYTADCKRTGVGDDSSDSECSSHSLIVPVTVHHKDNPANHMVVYALLDEQSDACFVTDSVLNRMNVSGESVSLKLSTVLAEETVACQKVAGLVIKGLREPDSLALPMVYSRDGIPAKRSQIPRPETAREWRHLAKIADQLTPHLGEVEIGLLIGTNCSQAIRPLEVVAGAESDPYAVKTALGWGVIGNMSATKSDQSTHFAFATRAREISPMQIVKMFEQDFSELTGKEEATSVEDRRFLEKVSAGIRQRDDGHFELPLPFRNDNVRLPNNKDAVLARQGGLKVKLTRDSKYKRDYCDFMFKLIDGRHAELVPEDEIDVDEGQTWYIPHHGVYHPRKPDKLRVVFDCAAQFHGEALNQHLLRGPDLINNLSGVLTRFRKDQVAFTCDIESMFYQVAVPASQRNLLRFLWWKDGDMSQPMAEYRMTVHLFGATSSPGCANFALKSTADKFREEYGDVTADFVKRDFYVDDGLKSLPTPSEAASLIESSRQLCSRGGFNLRAYTCNDKGVIQQIPVENRAKEFQSIDLHHDELPVERTLGIVWSVESDEFQFRVELKNRPSTRRGLLSTISSVFDPLGLVSPFILKGKMILQRLCISSSGWDDPLPDDIKEDWEEWRQELHDLPRIKIPRCYKTKELGEVTSVELHHFSDASMEGYGQCSYAKLTDNQGRSESSLVMAKSRVAPSKSTTIPRLELTAALTSARISSFLGKELDYQEAVHYYYTDSKVVLGYIGNESRKFHIFVANRVREIRDTTPPESWRYVRTEENPADFASRGMSVSELVNSSLWWKGPPFLVTGPPLPALDHPLSHQDPEVKKEGSKMKTDSPTATIKEAAVFQTRVDVLKMEVHFKSFSSWFKLKRAVALCIKYMAKLRTKDRNSHYSPVNQDDLERAEAKIIRMVQAEAYPMEVKALKRTTDGTPVVNRSSTLLSLEPFLDDDSLLRVGGRLRRSSMPDCVKHPFLLPQDSHTSKLIIAHYHRKVSHAGRGMTLNSLRQRFWIVGARTAVTLHIMNCVICRRLRGKPCGQRMADLPVDRLEPAAPFTFSAVDYFGPFLIKEGRSALKRWGVLFSCLPSRAIHLETANHLTTDSFLNAYRRFVCRRGTVRQLRCDRGTNFVGGRNELVAALSEMDNDKIRRELLKDECDWVEFNMNVPHASHMGGAWERMVGSARTVLASLLTQSGQQLDDESLRTLFAETECIVNSRPLTVVDTNSADLEPLSPVQILTLKSQVVKPPPGVFVRQDIYCRKRWRRVQMLANQFWTRWRAEFLSALQPRKKWNHAKRNIEPDDIVLMMDEELPRNQWPLGRVVEVFPGQDGLVRKVKIVAKGKVYERPIHKLVLLIGDVAKVD